MGAIYIFFLIGIITILASYLFKIEFVEALPVANFIIIIILYISGILFLNLNIGIILLIFIIIGVLVRIYKNKGYKKKSYFFETGIIYFTIIFLFSLLFPYRRQFITWDEFTHWGLVIKNMYSLNCFGNLEEATTAFKGYPPAISIFQYFFMKTYGHYRESLAFSAVIFFNLSLLAPLLKSIKSLLTILLLTIVILGFTTIISLEIYTTIYIDLTLGTLASYILFTFSKNEKVTEVDSIVCGLGLFLLPLVKSSGTFLGVMILAIIIVSLLKEDYTKKEKILKIFVFIFCLVLGKYSWDIYTKITSNFSGAWDGMKRFTMNRFLKFWLNGIGEKYQFETKANFINALSENIFNINILKEYNISFLSLMLIIIIIAFFIYILSNNKKKIKSILYGIILIGIIYVFGLLNLYIYTFSEYEAVRIASFSRYLNTYLIFAFFSIFYIIINKLKLNLSNKKLNLILLMLCFLLIAQYKEIKLQFFKSIEREKYNQKLKKILTKNDNLYFIAQRTDGYQYWVARYEYTPAKMINAPYSIGEKYFEGDIWTANISKEELEEKIFKSDYVYLYKIDDQFRQKYGEVFIKQNLNLEDGDIFKVDKKEDKVKLIKLNKE